MSSEDDSQNRSEDIPVDPEIMGDAPSSSDHKEDDDMRPTVAYFSAVLTVDARAKYVFNNIHVFAMEDNDDDIGITSSSVGLLAEGPSIIHVDVPLFTVALTPSPPRHLFPPHPLSLVVPSLQVARPTNQDNGKEIASDEPIGSPSSSDGEFMRDVVRA
ncbi:Uncharacterized protein Fot_12048 [Forsythia ovata]|uniref:Uncharacterized protein n=1 Tax=Forsythia ovata TaxID=205694 RepID=A0ABD1WPA1_9LAMI